MDDKSPRLPGIASLPDFMQADALVDWATTAAILNSCVPQARKILRQNDVPLVRVSERKALPRWGALRAFLAARESKPAA